jgi:hypothetical protein
MSVLFWLRAEGFGVLALSILLFARTGASWWLFAALLLAPDLAMLPYLVNPKIGSISYNLAHNYLFPLVLALAALAFRQSRVLPYVLIWTAHIGMDRALGYGLKYPTAFKNTHLATRI